MIREYLYHHTTKVRKITKQANLESGNNMYTTILWIRCKERLYVLKRLTIIDFGIRQVLKIYQYAGIFVNLILFTKHLIL